MYHPEIARVKHYFTCATLFSEPRRRGRHPFAASGRRRSKIDDRLDAQKLARSATFFARFLSILRKKCGKVRNFLAKLRKDPRKLRKNPGKLHKFRRKRAHFAAILRKKEAFSRTFLPNCEHFPPAPHSIYPLLINTSGQLINNCRFSIRVLRSLIRDLLFVRTPAFFRHVEDICT